MISAGPAGERQRHADGGWASPVATSSSRLSTRSPPARPADQQHRGRRRGDQHRRHRDPARSRCCNSSTSAVRGQEGHRTKDTARAPLARYTSPTHALGVRFAPARPVGAGPARLACAGPKLPRPPRPQSPAPGLASVLPPEQRLVAQM